jgi:importin-4
MSKTVTERSMAVAALGEITKALKAGMANYTGELLTTFMTCLDDESIEVSSNTVYGLGLVLENTTEDLSGYVTSHVLYINSSQYTSILTKLQRFFSDDAPRNAKDNAVGCVSRMIIRHPNAVPLDLVLPPSTLFTDIFKVLPAVVGALPLEDFIENEPTYQMIIQLYQANNPVMLALTEQLLPALAQVLTEDESKEEQIPMALRLQLLELVKVLRQEYPQLF